MSEETKKKIVRYILYMFPMFFILVLLLIVQIKNNGLNNPLKKEHAPIMDVTTEEAAMSYSETVNSAVLYLKNIEGAVTIKTDNYDYYEGCSSTVEKQNIKNKGKNKIISKSIAGIDSNEYYEATYSIFGEKLEDCIFRVLPETKTATLNKYQYMGIDFQNVNMYVGSQSCNEVDIQYKKALHINNQNGMFYIHVDFTNPEDIERLGFRNIDITGRLQPMGEETKDYIANISCYITENGFEFFSDRSISRITLDRDVSDLEHWETVYLTDTKNFIFNATELTVDGKSYSSTPTDSE